MTLPTGPTSETVGLPKLPPRDPAHEDPEWFQRDLDDEINDPDEPYIDKMPTERYFRIPD